MLRDAGAALAGLASAVGLVYVIQLLGHTIYAPPPGLDQSDAEAMAAYVATLPAPALLFPLFAYFIGTFVGTLLASVLGTARPAIFAFAVGILVLAGAISSLIVIPHPLWFSIAAVAGIITSAWLAVMLAPTGNSSRTPSAQD